MSDYIFLERSVHDIYVWIWFILHVWKCDRFAALKWDRIRSLELKSYITIIILLALPLGSFYDIFLTKIIYTSKLYLLNIPNVMVQENAAWPEENKQWISPISYALMVEFSFQIAILFLLQCFWNYLSNSIAKASFMSRFEFKLYIFLGVVSAFMFPVIQAAFSGLVTLREAIPQLVYGAQLILLTVLGIQTHYRFVRLIQISYNNKNDPHIITKIHYFIDMNKVLTLTLFVTGASFLILGSDVLINSRPITNSKVVSDLLVAHINFAAIIEWLVLILIIYPRKGFVGTGSGGNSLHSTIQDSINSQSMKPYASGLEVNRDSYTRLGSYNNNIDQCIESDKYSSNDSSNESPISSQMLPAVPTPVVSPPNSISSNSAPSVTPKSKLKRNISLSRDGKMIYGDTEPLGKVGGSEFVAVEKVDPRVMPFYFAQPSIDTASQQSSKLDDHDSRKSTQEERMLVLQRQHDEFNALRMNAMKSQQSLPLKDGNKSVSSSAMRSQQSVLLNNDNKSVSSSANTFIEDQQDFSALSHAKRYTEASSVLSTAKRFSEAISYEESEDGYFYAM